MGHENYHYKDHLGSFSNELEERLSSLACCLVTALSCYLATDLQFAFTHEGKSVPFATAGDCYSAAGCPQVRNKIFIYVPIFNTIFILFRGAGG